MHTTCTVDRAAKGKINVVYRLGPNPVTVGKLFALLECARSPNRTQITATPCSGISMLPQLSRSAIRFAQIKPIKYLKDWKWTMNKSSCSLPSLGQIPRAAFFITQGSTILWLGCSLCANMRTQCRCGHMKPPHNSLRAGSQCKMHMNPPEAIARQPQHKTITCLADYIRQSHHKEGVMTCVEKHSLCLM